MSSYDDVPDTAFRRADGSFYMPAADRQGRQGTARTSSQGTTSRSRLPGASGGQSFGGLAAVAASAATETYNRGQQSSSVQFPVQQGTWAASPPGGSVQFPVQQAQAQALQYAHLGGSLQFSVAHGGAESRSNSRVRTRGMYVDRPSNGNAGFSTGGGGAVPYADVMGVPHVHTSRTTREAGGYYGGEGHYMVDPQLLGAAAAQDKQNYFATASTAASPQAPNRSPRFVGKAPAHVQAAANSILGHCESQYQFDNFNGDNTSAHKRSPSRKDRMPALPANAQFSLAEWAGMVPGKQGEMQARAASPQARHVSPTRRAASPTAFYGAEVGAGGATARDNQNQQVRMSSPVRARHTVGGGPQERVVQAQPRETSPNPPRELPPRDLLARPRPEVWDRASNATETSKPSSESAGAAQQGQSLPFAGGGIPGIGAGGPGGPGGHGGLGPGGPGARATIGHAAAPHRVSSPGRNNAAPDSPVLRQHRPRAAMHGGGGSPAASPGISQKMPGGGSWAQPFGPAKGAGARSPGAGGNQSSGNVPTVRDSQQAEQRATSPMRSTSQGDAANMNAQNIRDMKGLNSAGMGPQAPSLGGHGVPMPQVPALGRGGPSGASGASGAPRGSAHAEAQARGSPHGADLQPRSPVSANVGPPFRALPSATPHHVFTQPRGPIPEDDEMSGGALGTDASLASKPELVEAPPQRSEVSRGADVPGGRGPLPPATNEAAPLAGVGAPLGGAGAPLAGAGAPPPSGPQEDDYQGGPPEGKGGYVTNPNAAMFVPRIAANGADYGEKAAAAGRSASPPRQQPQGGDGGANQAAVAAARSAATTVVGPSTKPSEQGGGGYTKQGGPTGGRESSDAFEPRKAPKVPPPLASGIVYEDATTGTDCVIIALDVDEVLCCYVDGFRKFLVRERPNGPLDPQSVFREAHDPHSPWRQQFAVQGGLDKLEAVPGSVAALRRLRLAGTRLEVVTSRPPIMRESTEALLAGLFPPCTFAASHFVGPGEKGLTCNKIGALALVDDQIPNVIDAHQCGVVSVLFDLGGSYPWSVCRPEDLPPGVPRIESWSSTCEYLVKSLNINAPQESSAPTDLYSNANDYPLKLHQKVQQAEARHREELENYEQQRQQQQQQQREQQQQQQQQQQHLQQLQQQQQRPQQVPNSRTGPALNWDAQKGPPMESSRGTSDQSLPMRFNNNGYAPPTITWDNNTKPISPGRQDAGPMFGISNTGQQGAPLGPRMHYPPGHPGYNPNGQNPEQCTIS